MKLLIVLACFLTPGTALLPADTDTVIPEAIEALQTSGREMAVTAAKPGLLCTEFPCYLRSVYSWKNPKFADYMLKDAMAKRITSTISAAYVCPGPKSQSVNKYLKFDSAAKLQEYEQLQAAAFNPPDFRGPRADCNYNTYEMSCWLTMLIKSGAKAEVNDLPILKANWDAAVQGDACVLCAPHTDTCVPHTMN